MTEPTPILSAHNLCKSFGGLKAVHNACIQVQPGSITGLIGPNGAGKSTFFSLLANFVRPDQGTVIFAGEPIHHLPPHAIAQRGLVRTFQVPRVLSRLTLLENMLLAEQDQIGEKFWQVWLKPGQICQQERQLQQKAEHLLETVGLIHMRDRYAGSLSGGQRKLLEMARALMADPQLILLDEPAAGVNPALIDQIASHIQTWNQAGLSFLIIEHNMDLIMSLCDQVWVMAEGKNLAQGTPQAIRQSPQVLEAYLGSE